MIGAFLRGHFAEALILFMDRIRYHLQPVHLKTGSHSPKCFWGKTKKSLLILLRIYSITLFVGTNYILWPFTVMVLLKAGLAEAIVLPTFGLNLVIETIDLPSSNSISFAEAKN